jgi:hypothetical protein
MFDGELPQLLPVPCYVSSTRVAREDQEAHELLESEKANEAYM